MVYWIALAILLVGIALMVWAKVHDRAEAYEMLLLFMGGGILVLIAAVVAVVGWVLA